MIDVLGLRPAVDAALGIGRWCTCYQVSASVDGTVILDIAVGEDATGQPVCERDLFAIYCASKPFAAVLVGHLVDLGELSLDDVVADIVDADVHPSLGQVRVEELLSHTAGLPDRSALPFRLLPPRERKRRIASLVVRPELRGRSQYTEYAGWQVLQYVIEDLTGMRFDHALQEKVLSPWKIEAYFGLEAADRTLVDRVRLNADMQRPNPAPILWERSPSNLSEVRAADGCYASMTEVRRFFHRTIDALHGVDATVVSSSTLRQLTEHGRADVFHDALGRKCGFGLGFMTNLGSHSFGDRHSLHSFGHSGLSGMTWAAVEPTLGLAYAVHANGVTGWSPEGGPERRPELRRRAFGNALLDAVREAYESTPS